MGLLMKTIVTIGMCLHNCENSLGDAIDSIVDQDFPHDLIEIVFVDDGSNDGTLLIIQDYVKRIDIKSKVYHTVWGGIGAARQLALDNASGKYLLWVDGDQILSQNYVRKQINFMEKNPEVGITSGLVGFLENNMILNLELVPFMVDHLLFEKPRSHIWKTKKLPGTGATTFKVEALRGINGFDKRFTIAGEDMDAVKRIENDNWAIKLNNAIYYEKKGGMSRITDVLNKHFWYGYGSYRFYRKDRTIVSFSRMTPIAGIMTGLFYSISAYEFFSKRCVFLLPLLFFIKNTAWCIGFAKGQLS
jgi:glycosyltransferase involved in cell wall biosynthesis